MFKSFGFPLLAALMLLPSTVPAYAAYQCPATNAPAGFRASVTADTVLANDPSVSRSVMTAIDRLREQGLRSGEIVDQLVIAYCSRIGSQTGLSDAIKDEQVGQFASNLASFVYRPRKNSPEDIVINVPVPTRLYDRLRQAAKTANVSESAWTIGVIRDRLAAP